MERIHQLHPSHGELFADQIQKMRKCTALYFLNIHENSWVHIPCGKLISLMKVLQKVETFGRAYICEKMTHNLSKTTPIYSQNETCIAERSILVASYCLLLMNYPTSYLPPQNFEAESASTSQNLLKKLLKTKVYSHVLLSKIFTQDTVVLTWQPFSNNKKYGAVVFKNSQDMFYVNIYKWKIELVPTYPQIAGDSQTNFSLTFIIRQSKQQTFQCPPGAFQCSDLSCITSQNICDGTKQCSDGRDENNDNCSSFHFMFRKILSLDIKRNEKKEQVTDNTEFKVPCHIQRLANTSNTYPYHRTCVFDRRFPNCQGIAMATNLLFCKSHKCFREYKCPNSYCIPYRAICDHLFDCPAGEDEEGCGNWSCTGENNQPLPSQLSFLLRKVLCFEVFSSISGLFKCTKEIMCLHNSEVCDGIAHCKGSIEDEMSCSVVKSCPAVCLCAHLYVVCNIDIFPSLLSLDQNVLALRVVHGNTNMTHQAHFLEHLSNLVYLDISWCKVDLLGDKMFSSLRSIVHLDSAHSFVHRIVPDVFQNGKLLKCIYLQHNWLHKLSTGSFKGLDSLQILNLSSNIISYIESHSFQFVEEVSVFDISNNSLTSIVSKSIEEIKTIKVLNLAGNDFLMIYISTQISEIYVDNDGFCCVLEHKKCLSGVETSGTHGCGNLIKSSAAIILLWTFVCLGFAVNFLSLVMDIVRKSQAELSYLNKSFVLINKLRCHFALGVLTSHTHHGNDYSFLGIKWRERRLCFVLGIVFIFSKQMAAPVLFGSACIHWKIVSAKKVVQPGERSKHVVRYLLSCSLLWLTTGIVSQFFVPMTSGFCLSLHINQSAKTFSKVMSVVTLFTTAIWFLLTFALLGKILVEIRDVEKKVNKNRSKKWFVKLSILTTVNFTCALGTDIFATCGIFRVIAVQEWIYVILSLVPVVLHSVTIL